MLKKNAAMYGHITSGVMSNDAHHITSFDCNARQIAHSIRKALHESALGAVDYVNCHGTATEKNDTIETRGIKDGFGCSVNGVSLSSTKPMTGHLLGASGSVELILSLLAMKNNYVPPTINLVDPDPECDLDYTALRGVQKDIASVMSLSYGFGGHIGAIIARKI